MSWFWFFTHYPHPVGALRCPLWHFSQTSWGSAHRGTSTPARSDFQAHFRDSFPDDGHECPKDELELASSDPEVASSAFNCASSGPEPASSAFNYASSDPEPASSGSNCASSDPELATSVSHCVPSLSHYACSEPERARSGRFLRTRRCRIAGSLHGQQTAHFVILRVKTSH